MKTILLSLLLTCVLTGGYGQERQNLKVLYVGYAPDRPLPEHYKTATGGDLMENSFKPRMAQFKAMLSRYFTEVETIDAREYAESLSENFDVTIFDALPNPIVEPKLEPFTLAGFTFYRQLRPGQYLSDTFNRPAIFIGEMAYEMGYYNGLKTDCYCHCLSNHALNMRLKHTIFNAPFKTELTIENRPTPDGVYVFSEGWKVPRTTPMWRVSRDGSRVGMISGWYGYEDAPDAEIISGGSSVKSYDAVAISRHANYMLWGYAAEPEDLTKEAQTIFANAVCYMSKFAGQTPQTRAYLPVATRDEIAEFMEVLSPEGYATYKKGVKTFNDYLADCQSKGERLGESQMQTLSHYEYIQKNSRDQLVTKPEDIESVRQFLTDNFEYINGSYSSANRFRVDENAKTLKLSNREIASLDRCITMLEKGDAKSDKALAMLKTYTMQSFTQPKEWRTWYKANKNKLYFTESGGYRFMGDGSENVRPDDFSSHVQKDPVKVGAAMTFDGKVSAVEVTLSLLPDYHVYASSSNADSPFILTEVEVFLPEGMTKSGDLILPASEQYYADRSMRIYSSRENKFQQPVVIDRAKFNGGKIRCVVRYQSCNATSCLPPKEEECFIESM